MPKQHTKNTSILAKGSKNDFNDVIYTPEEIVLEIMEWLKPHIKPEHVLFDPFAGGGVFYDNFPKENKKLWCEIEKGKDFKDFDGKVDWIITNPPYSKFTDILIKSFEIADNVVYLIPHNKVYASDKRMDMIEEYGDFTFKRFKVPKAWTAKFPIAAYWFKRKKPEGVE